MKRRRCHATPIGKALSFVRCFRRVQHHWRNTWTERGSGTQHLIVQRKFWNSMLNWSGMFDMPYANLPQGSCHHWWIGVDCGDVECLKELPFLSLPSWRTEMQIYQSSFTGMEPNLLKKQNGNLIQFPYIHIYICKVKFDICVYLFLHFSISLQET